MQSNTSVSIKRLNRIFLTIATAALTEIEMPRSLNTRHISEYTYVVNIAKYIAELRNGIRSTNLLKVCANRILKATIGKAVGNAVAQKNISKNSYTKLHDPGNMRLPGTKKFF